MPGPARCASSSVKLEQRLRPPQSSGVCTSLRVPIVALPAGRAPAPPCVYSCAACSCLPDDGTVGTVSDTIIIRKVVLRPHAASRAGAGFMCNAVQGWRVGSMSMGVCVRPPSLPPSLSPSLPPSLPLPSSVCVCVCVCALFHCFHHEVCVCVCVCVCERMCVHFMQQCISIAASHTRLVVSVCFGRAWQARTVVTVRPVHGCTGAGGCAYAPVHVCTEVEARVSPDCVAGGVPSPTGGTGVLWQEDLRYAILRGLLSWNKRQHEKRESMQHLYEIWRDFCKELRYGCAGPGQRGRPVVAWEAPPPPPPAALVSSAASVPLSSRKINFPQLFRVAEQAARMAVHRRRSPPPPQTKVTITGKNEIYNREHLVGPILDAQTFGSQTPPPPLPPLLILPWAAPPVLTGFFFWDLPSSLPTRWVSTEPRHPRVEDSLLKTRTCAYTHKYQLAHSLSTSWSPPPPPPPP